QKALSAILRTEERFGAGHVIDVVMGHETEKVRQHRHHLLPTFGAGTEMNRPAWQGILRQMMAYDLVRPDPARHGALRMTEHALPILKGSEAITLRRDALIAKTRATAKALVAEEDAGLLAALKAKRRALAQAQNVPAYVVFSDRTLIEMAQRRPSDLDEMMDVPGVGAKKLEKYGTAFLSVVTGETAGAQHPVRRKLAGHGAGALFDRLTEVQAGLARGPEGTDKPLGCSAPLLARVAAQRPRSQEALTRLLGERRAERFGEAFLAVLRER
ncbi:MAG: HRDC domain-containing protein, partial [Pseudomonadota bacterium]